MKKVDIEALLKKLDEELILLNESRELVICGGAAMILSNYEREETQDIDMLRPDKDKVLQELSVKISNESNSLRPDWLNSNCAVFLNDSLPEGWSERIILKFEGKNLCVKVLAPQDILHTKICAHLDREMDEDDIRELVQDRDAFKDAVTSVMKLKRFQGVQSELIIAELEVKLGLNDG